MASVRRTAGASENTPVTRPRPWEDKAKSTILHEPEKPVEPAGKFTFHATRSVPNTEGSTGCRGRAPGTVAPAAGMPEGFLEGPRHISRAKASCTMEGGKGVPGDVTAGAEPGGVP